MGSPLLIWCQQDWNLCKIVRLYFQNVFQIYPFFTSAATTTHQDYYASFATGRLPFLAYLKSTFQKATVMFFGNVSWIIPCLKLLFLQPYAHFPCTLVTLVPQIWQTRCSLWPRHMPFLPLPQADSSSSFLVSDFQFKWNVREAAWRTFCGRVLEFTQRCLQRSVCFLYKFNNILKIF